MSNLEKTRSERTEIFSIRPQHKISGRIRYISNLIHSRIKTFQFAKFSFLCQRFYNQLGNFLFEPLHNFLSLPIFNQTSSGALEESLGHVFCAHGHY